MEFKGLSIFYFCLVLISCSTTSVKTKAIDGLVTKHQQIVIVAKRQIGRPYQYGGETPRGFDCSGLVKYIYSSVGVELPRISRFQAKRGKKIALSSAQKGDLLFFGSQRLVTHVGIVISKSNGYPVMIHSSSSKGVIETNLDNSRYWMHRFLYAKRVF